jgi:hypothetical protein
MILNDSFLADAGWLFLAAWSAVVAALSIVAFGRDLLPWKAHFDAAPESQPADRVHRTQPTVRQS